MSSKASLGSDGAGSFTSQVPFSASSSVSSEGTAKSYCITLSCYLVQQLYSVDMYKNSITINRR